MDVKKIWALYGFSALNILYSQEYSYNILDLVSKNFMEIYLSVVLLMVLRVYFQIKIL